MVVLAAALRSWNLGYGLPQVYEEATPLRQAWEMWGWGPARAFDLNPHFFHYPSLTFYLHLLLQAILYLGMKATGAIASPIDFQAIYLAEPTPFLLAGRALNVAFGAGTVAAVFALARRAGGAVPAVIASGWLAVNAFHVAQSRLVAVDVPLACLVTVGLLACVRAAEVPTRRRFASAGIVIGLAASVKYTGAMLALPLLAAWLLARRHGARVADLALAGAAAAIVFAATSPYVLLDFGAFREQFLYEWRHMHEGHFGVEASSSWGFYADALRRILGWPLALLALGGTVHRAVVRREPWAVVTGLFAVAGALSVGSWAMKAERYLLPVVPAAVALGAAGLSALFPLARARPALRVPLATGAALLVALPAAGGLAGQLARTGPDTRTQAKAWIEANVPPGACIVTESYGPELLGPITLVGVDAELAEALRARGVTFALQGIPMSQTDPELIAPFYDLALYRTADYLVTSSGVRERYAAEPGRFARQAAFYEEVERAFERVRAFEPGDGPGPTIVVYRNPEPDAPFATRESVPAIAPLTGVAEPFSGEEGFFYYSLGLNHETFGFPDAAVDAYVEGLRYPGDRRGVLRNLVMGAVRGLAARGRIRDALEVLQVGEARATEEADRAAIRNVREQILAQVGAPRPGPPAR